jgi:hypothetical protein
VRQLSQYSDWRWTEGLGFDSQYGHAIFSSSAQPDGIRGPPSLLNFSVNILRNTLNILKIKDMEMEFTKVYPKVSGLSHNEVNNNNNKHSLRSNIEDYDGKTH